MKENLKALLETLRAEQAVLEKERVELANQCSEFKYSRKGTAREALKRLVPDLSANTLKKLRQEVPGFKIPMVSSWFGLSQKIDPSLTVDMLRIQLGAYLDNEHMANALERSPDEWRDVVRNDDLVRGLQEKLLPLNAERRADVDARIEALEKLSRADMRKMKPEVRERMEQAIAAQVAKPGSRLRYTKNSNVNYPTRQQVDSDSGPDLLTMWLWYELLSPNSASSHEIERVQGGGGEFGGGGAVGNWSDGNSTNQTQASDLSTDATSLGVVAAELGNIESHYDAGAGSFS